MLRHMVASVAQFRKSMCNFAGLCASLIAHRVHKVSAEVSDTVLIYRTAASQLWSSLVLYVPLLLHVCRPNIPLSDAATFLKESIDRAGLEPATEDMDYRYVLMTTPPRRLFAADPPSRVKRQIRLADLAPSRYSPNSLTSSLHSFDD